MSSKGGSEGLTEFAMGMLDLSRGLLKSLPEKPALSRVGSESEGLGSMRQRSIAEGYGYGLNGSGGFTIGGSRDGNSSVGGEREDADNIRSGLASPTNSVSSSGGSASAGFEGFQMGGSRQGGGVRTLEEAY